MNAPQTVRKLFSRSTSRAFSIWGGAIVVAMLLGQTASATPLAIYDSIDGFTSTGSGVGDADIWLGNNFKTDASTYDLNSVVLNLLRAPSGGTIGVDIFGDSSGAPGTILGTLTNPGIFVAGLNTFTVSGSIPLSSGSSFWMVLRGVEAGVVTWLSTNGSSGVGASTSTSFSTNAGSTWGSSTGSPYMMTVYATATSSPVPEIDPASFGSALSLLLGSLTLLERRRRQG